MNTIFKTLFSTIILLFLGGSFCSAQSFSKYYTSTGINAFLDLEELDESVNEKHLNIHLLNAAIFHLTNIERQNHNLTAFEFNSNLYKSAQLHSDKMIALDFFDHLNKKEKKWREPKDRILYFDKTYSALGENIVENNLLNYKGTSLNYRTVKNETGGLIYLDTNNEEIKNSTYLQLANRLVRQWMNSKPHRENILNKSFSLLACACTINPNEVPILIRCTQNFGNK
jgi:uncharacterized protein YkwD